MPDQLTPEEIQQAVARVRAQFDRLPDSDAVLVPKVDLRAVLALTEQVEKLDDEVLKWTAIAGGHAEQVEALTEQQPEPVAEPRLPLWWSAEHGLITVEDGVWWRYANSRVSLRHDGLPNEKPADAVRLTITRKQPAHEPSPVCDCGEAVERWGQPCGSCRNPVVIVEVDDA